MLDKSIPHKDMLMVINNCGQLAVEEPQIPQGYSVRRYRSGDEAHWAAIETSVGEFDSEEAALKYFEKEYLPYPDELCRRMLFACDSTGVPVATSSAWFWRGEPARPILHWVATMPEHQGKGLAGALVRKCVIISRGISSGQDMCLHTQTWSHRAVRLYHSIGFRLVKNSIEGQKNDYDSAIEVLKQVYPEEYLKNLAASSVVI